MAQLVSIVYVGTKPTAYDNIARSGVTWDGCGDVQQVTDVQAKQLLRYPDQWALLDEEDRSLVNAPISLTAKDEVGDLILVDPDAMSKSLERMSKVELSAYAKFKWGKELTANKRRSTKDMIDQIEEWEKELDVIVGSGR